MELFDYQKTGAAFLAANRVALLADEMGIGKSAQAIAACDKVNAENILVICRAVARENWGREFEKFATKKRRCHIIYNRSDADHLDGGITICSYEAVPYAVLANSRTYDCVVIDESHYVKEPSAERTRDILGKSGVIHRGKQTFLLTGTPTPNHAGELWTTLYSFGRTGLSYDGFLERYCISRVTSYGRQVTGSVTDKNKIAELREMLRPICLRRTKEDVNLELPPISFNDIIVAPGKVELLLCKSFVNYVVPVDHTDLLIQQMERELGIINGIVKGGFTMEAMNALAARAKSIATVCRYNSMQKVEPVVEMVSEELRNNDYKKIVIFAIYRDTIVALQEKLAKEFGAVLIFGGTKPERMQDRIDRFQNTEKCRVFIAQLHCAGTSLTLTAADQAMFVDLDWVPGNNLQAAKRLHRIGQTRPVTVRCVALKESIDGHIANLLARKTKEIATLTEGAMSDSQPKGELPW